jgi:hypothetical protein
VQFTEFGSGQWLKCDGTVRNAVPPPLDLRNLRSASSDIPSETAYRCKLHPFAVFSLFSCNFELTRQQSTRGISAFDTRRTDVRIGSGMVDSLSSLF